MGGLLRGAAASGSSIRAAIALWFAFCCGLAAADEAPVPPLSGRVVDAAGVLDAAQKRALEASLESFELRKGTQIVVLIVGTTFPEPIESFSIRVAETWKIGRKGVDDGLLIIVASNDRAMRIEVGYGLEGIIPDAVAKRLIEEVFIPYFRAGDFGLGLSAGVERVMRLIDGEPLPPPEPRMPAGGTQSLQGYFVLFMVMVFVVGGVLRAVLGRLAAASVVGVGTGLLAWLIAAPLLAAALVGVVAFIFTLFGGAGGGIGGGRRGRGGGFGTGGFGAGASVAAASEAAAEASVAAGRRGGGEMTIARLLRHLTMPSWRLRRIFPPAALERIGLAIARAEAAHSGQIRFVVEHALDPVAVIPGRSARERALEVFSLLGVWDTEQNNGVLVYLLLADHDVEIVADRGIDAKVGSTGWARICHHMEDAFRKGRFEEGVLAGIEDVSRQLQAHFPRTESGPNELPDRPVIL